MVSHDSNLLCAADALFRVTPLTGKGKAVGILRLCDTTAEIRQLGLSEDAGIWQVVIERAKQCNFIPQSPRNAFAGTFRTHIRATEQQEKPGGV